MIKIIKQIFCRHSWRVIREPGLWLNGYYGCIKCGKTEEVYLSEEEKWVFDQKHKGATFNDRENE